MVVPEPYFPRGLLSVACINNKFPFLNALQSCKDVNSAKIDVISQRFFTIPVEIMRDRNPILCARGIRKVVQKRKTKTDLIHANRLDNGFAGACLKEQYGIPLVITSHGSDVYDFPFKNDFTYAVAKYALGKANHVIAVSKSDADRLLSLGMPRSRVSVIPNGVNSDLFKPIPKRISRTELGLPTNKKIILTIGTLHEVKGQSFFIDAMSILRREIQDFTAIVIGSGPLEKSLRKRIEKLGLSQEVLMYGWLPHNQLPLWISACDVFVLPSLNEGLPTVIPEVMACGRPVVGTRVGGIPEVVSSNETGFLVKPQDAESLAQAISEALGREWNSEDIREHAKKYSLREISQRVIQVYERVI